MDLFFQASHRNQQCANHVPTCDYLNCSEIQVVGYCFEFNFMLKGFFLRFACCCPRTFTGHYVLIVGGGWALCCSMTRIRKLGCAPAPIQRKNMQPWFKKVGKYWEVAGIILLFIFEIQPLNTEPQYFSGDVTGKCDGSLKVFKTLPHAWCWLNPTQVLDQSSLEAMTERLWLPEDGMGTWGIAVHKLKYWKLVKLLRSWRAKIKSKKFWILIFIGLKVGLWQGEYIICIAQHLKKNIITYNQVYPNSIYLPTNMSPNRQELDVMELLGIMLILCSLPVPAPLVAQGVWFFVSAFSLHPRG